MKKRWTDRLRFLYCLMIVVFLVLLTFFAVPEGYIRQAFFVYAILALGFLVMGIVLAVLALKSRESKLAKIFLVMMGASAAGILTLSVLHNVFYAFAMLSEGIVVLVYLFEFLHGAAFLLSLIGCPLAFIVGAVGALVVWHGELLKIS